MRKATKPAKPVRARVVPKPDEELPPIDIIADDIAILGRAARSLVASRLREEAVILLLSHSSKLPQKTVRTVLSALRSLEDDYLKPKAPKP